MPRLYIETVGCQMNVLDSELVAADLLQSGYELVFSPKGADVILFNTCSVRQHAKDKIYSALGRLKHVKEHRPGAIIGVLGCMAQKDQEKIFKRAPHVDLVVGPGQLRQIPALIERLRAGRGKSGGPSQFSRTTGGLSQFSPGGLSQFSSDENGTVPFTGAILGSPKTTAESPHPRPLSQRERGDLIDPFSSALPLIGPVLEVSLDRKAGSRSDVRESFEKYDPHRTSAVQARAAGRRWCGSRSAATSSARIALCPACAGRNRAVRPGRSKRKSAGWPTTAASKSRSSARRSTATATLPAAARCALPICSPGSTKSTASGGCGSSRTIPAT